MYSPEIDAFMFDFRSLMKDHGFGDSRPDISYTDYISYSDNSDEDFPDCRDYCTLSTNCVSPSNFGSVEIQGGGKYTGFFLLKKL